MYRRSRKDTSEEHSIIIIDKRKKKNPRKILNDISTKQDESIQNTNITDVNEIKDYQEESQINENKENRENSLSYQLKNTIAKETLILELRQELKYHIKFSFLPLSVD